MGDIAVTANGPETELIIFEDEQEPQEDQGESERPRWWVTAVLALLSGTLLGGLLHARYGYTSGTSDHMVLAPLGMHWADSTYFSNDWFIREAPQPHWFFDVVTWLGASINQLSAVYLGYWLVSLLVFGFATAILARTWAPRHQVVATVLVTLLAGITPWWLLGTGSPLWPQALPVVLAGSLLYLTVAALFADKRVLAVVAAVATAVVHVQQGLVVAVILLALVAVHLLRHKKVDWLYLGGAIVTGGVVYGALTARPVVGDLNDFAQVCTQIIPYHCEATSWPTYSLVAGLALVALAMLTVFYREPGKRLQWAMILLLPAIGLVGGVLSDRFDVPVLGVMAQGLNVYRLDVVMLMAACWGALTPLFTKGRLRLVLAAVVVGLGWLVLGQRAFEIKPVVPTHGGWWMLLFAAGLAAAAYLKRATWVRVAAVVMVAGLGAAMLAKGAVEKRPIDATFIPDDTIREWGAEVHHVLPGGSVLLAAPLAEYVRLSSGFGVVANCKDVPYGGDAWKHYEQRLNSMGGMTQCRSKDPGVFDKLSAEQVEKAAQRWGADYVVVEEGQAWRTPDMLARGWTFAFRPTGTLRNSVLKAPWA